MNFLPHSRLNSEEFLAWQYKVSGHKQKGLKTSLTTICKEYGIEGFDENLAHEAVQDSIMTWEVWNRVKFQVDI